MNKTLRIKDIVRRIKRIERFVEVERDELLRVAKKRLEGKFVWITPRSYDCKAQDPVKVKVRDVEVTKDNDVVFTADIVGEDWYYDEVYVDQIVGANFYGS